MWAPWLQVQLLSLSGTSSAWVPLVASTRHVIYSAFQVSCTIILWQADQSDGLNHFLFSLCCHKIAGILCIKESLVQSWPIKFLNQNHWIHFWRVEMKLFAVTALLFALAAVVHGRSSVACFQCLASQAPECMGQCVVTSPSCHTCLQRTAPFCIPYCFEVLVASSSVAACYDQ